MRESVVHAVVVVIVAAILPCLATAAREPTLLCLTKGCSLTTQHNPGSYMSSPLGYASLTLNFKGGMPASKYQAFIDGLRSKLLSQGSSKAHGIPVTPPKDKIADDQRVVFASIINQRGQNATLIIDSSTTYIVGFANKNNVFYLGNSNDLYFSAQKYKLLFQNRQEVRLPTILSDNYVKLEEVAQQRRSQIPLSASELSASIIDLFFIDGTVGDDDLQVIASRLLVVCQMVLDAARYYPIEIKLAQIMGSPSGTIYPDSLMTGLEDRWMDFSKQIQFSTESGVFGSIVLLQHPAWGVVHFDRVDDYLRSSLAFIADATTACKSKPDYQACKVGQPTGLMLGWAGSNYGVWLDCINAPEYNDQVVVETSACSTTNEGQRWRFNPEDKTIRTFFGGDWCLGADPEKGSHSTTVKLYACQNVALDIIQWDMFDNGTIKHAKSKWFLVRTYTLSLESRPGRYMKWSVDTNPFRTLAVNIIGPNNLCITRDSKTGSAVTLTKCQIDDDLQQFYLHRNSKLESVAKTDMFLNGVPSAPVTVVARKDSYQQVWSFDNDGTIRNLDNGYVLQSSGQQVTIVADPGTNKQPWRLMLAGVIERRSSIITI